MSLSPKVSVASRFVTSGCQKQLSPARDDTTFNFFGKTSRQLKFSLTGCFGSCQAEKRLTGGSCSCTTEIFLGSQGCSPSNNENPFGSLGSSPSKTKTSVVHKGRRYIVSEFELSSPTRGDATLFRSLNERVPRPSSRTNGCIPRPTPCVPTKIRLTRMFAL